MTRSMREIAVGFLKLGATAYGPAALGLMHAEFQERRQWLTKPEFVEGLALGQGQAQAVQLPMGEVLQTAAHPLRCGHGTALRQITLLTQDDRPASSGQVAGSGHPLQPTTHNQHIAPCVDARLGGCCRCGVHGHVCMLGAVVRRHEAGWTQCGA